MPVKVCRVKGVWSNHKYPFFSMTHLCPLSGTFSYNIWCMLVELRNSFCNQWIVANLVTIIGQLMKGYYKLARIFCLWKWNLKHIWTHPEINCARHHNSWQRLFGLWPSIFSLWWCGSDEANELSGSFLFPKWVFASALPYMKKKACGCAVCWLIAWENALNNIVWMGAVLHSVPSIASASPLSHVYSIARLEWMLAMKL